MTPSSQELESPGNPGGSDVKPDNILACNEGFKLADLGIVKWSDFDPRFTTGGTLTKESMQLGSWFYMAPEQQQSPHEAVPASDVYALGVTWIEMLTGKLPSPQAVGAGQYPRPCDDDEVCSLLRRMVAYSPGDRPTVTEIREGRPASFCLGVIAGSSRSYYT